MHRVGDLDCLTLVDIHTAPTEVLRGVAEQFRGGIPGMDSWVRTKGYGVRLTDASVRIRPLPKLLMAIARAYHLAAQDGVPDLGTAERYRKEDLRACGFLDFSDLKNKFAQLAAEPTWARTVLITVEIRADAEAVVTYRLRPSS